MLKVNNEEAEISFLNVSFSMWHMVRVLYRIGYNLGTPTMKPYKREIKTRQNDTAL